MHNSGGTRQFMGHQNGSEGFGMLYNGGNGKFSGPQNGGAKVGRMQNTDDAGFDRVVHGFPDKT